MIRGEYFRDTDAWKKEFGGLTPSQWADLWTSRLVGRRITALDPKKYETEYSSFEQIFPCGPPRYPLDMTISPSATAAQTNGRSKPSLMTLPTELLLQIIEEALSPSESYSEYCARGSSVSWFMFSGISLIFSCKRLYVLGRPIAIRHYTFDASQLPSTTFLFEPGSTPYDIFQEVDLRTNICFDRSFFVRRVDLNGVDGYYGWKRPAEESTAPVSTSSTLAGSKESLLYR